MVRHQHALCNIETTSLLLLFTLIAPAAGQSADKVESLRGQVRAALANGAPGAARDAAERWFAYASEAGRFTVDFPVAPALSQREMRMGNAVIVNRQARATVLSPLAVFSAEYRDVPPSWEKEGLADALERASGADVFAAAGLKVLSRRRLALGPHPAVEVTLEDSAGMPGRALMAVRGARLYSLSVFWEQGADGAPLAERFLASFRLAGDLPVSR
jgi:hypothetical protein